MKHLHVINKPLVGGAENIAAKLALEYSGGDLFALTTKAQLQSKFERKFGVRINKFRKLLHAIIQNDVIVFTHNLQAHIIVMLVCTMLKLIGRKHKVFTVIHFDIDTIGTWWSRLLNISILICRPNFIFVSEFAKKKFFRRIKLKNLSYQIIHNGIDVRHFGSKNKATLPALSNSFSIGFIGRYASVKRLELFLEICHQLTVMHASQLKVVIQSDITNQRLQQMLETHASSLTISDVVLLPADEDQRFFYQKSDIVLSTSLTETFCLVAIEALASRKRFYAFNLDSVDSIFAGHNYNLKADCAIDFCEKLVLARQNDYQIPNLDAFTQSTMMKRYGQIK